MFNSDDESEFKNTSPQQCNLMMGGIGVVAGGLIGGISIYGAIKVANTVVKAGLGTVGGLAAISFLLGTALVVKEVYQRNKDRLPACCMWKSKPSDTMGETTALRSEARATL